MSPTSTDDTPIMTRLLVRPPDEGLRLDQFLARLGHTSRRRMRTLIGGGGVRVVRSQLYEPVEVIFRLFVRTLVHIDEAYFIVKTKRFRINAERLFPVVYCLFGLSFPDRGIGPGDEGTELRYPLEFFLAAFDSVPPEEDYA